MSCRDVDRLGALADEFRELEARLADPGTASDLDLLRTVSRQYRELEPIVAAQTRSARARRPGHRA